MPNITIYHNPRCSKSRQTLQLLQEQGIEPVVIEYLNTPLSASELSAVLKKLKLNARDILRSNEQDYKDNQLKNPDLSEKQLIQAMIDYPKIMQRPIVVNGNKAAIGRPPEAVLEIL